MHHLCHFALFYSDCNHDLAVLTCYIVLFPYLYVLPTLLLFGCNHDPVMPSPSLYPVVKVLFTMLIVIQQMLQILHPLTYILLLCDGLMALSYSLMVQRKLIANFGHLLI